VYDRPQAALEALCVVARLGDRKVAWNSQIGTVPVLVLALKRISVAALPPSLKRDGLDPRASAASATERASAISSSLEAR
jgi:hypothetical protein